MISADRQGLVVLATPAFTATTPNAWPDGSAWPHCGYDTSFPVGVLTADAAAGTATITKVARTVPAIMPDLIDQPLSRDRLPLWPAPDHSPARAPPRGRSRV